MQVLIVKVSSMGDILHTLPSLTDAMQAISEISFDWLIEEDFIQIPSWHKSVNRIIPIAVRRWCKTWLSEDTKNESKFFYKRLRNTHYDFIIDAQGLIKTALIACLAHGTRHGMNWKTVREPAASIFYNYRYYIKKQQHAVERIRELFAKVLGYNKPEIFGDYAISQNFLRNTYCDNKTPYLIFLHATTQDNKHWPETHWRKLIKLVGKSGFHIRLPWWIPHEKARAKRLAKEFDYVYVLPRMRLEKIAQQLAGAAVIVSVDTGLSHLAAALDCPNITLYGPTNPVLIGNYGRNQYICRPKYSLDLKDISADIVFTQLELLLAKERNYA